MLSRKDCLYLRMTIEEAQRFQTCTRRACFAVLLDTFAHIIGTGYNGVPSGMRHCDQGACPRAKSTTASGSDYAGNCYAAHAEANCLLHSDYTVRRNGCTLYVNSTPCWGCGILIAHGSVTRLVCLDDGKDAQWPQVCQFLQAAQVQIETVSYEELCRVEPLPGL